MRIPYPIYLNLGLILHWRSWTFRLCREEVPYMGCPTCNRALQRAKNPTELKELCKAVMDLGLFGPFSIEIQVAYPVAHPAVK